MNPDVKKRIDEAVGVKPLGTKIRPRITYCRANVAPSSYGGYTPCMRIADPRGRCSIHGGAHLA